MPAALPFIIAGASAAGAGAGIYGAHKAGSVSKTQQQIAQENFARSKPAFDASFGYYNNLLTGGPSALAKALGPDINALNANYGNARSNLVGNALTRGGGLASRLTGLESNRAMNLSNLVGTARNSAASALGNLANGQQLAGLQALAGAQQSRTLSNAQSSEAWGNVGSFITRLLSSPDFMSKFGGGNEHGSTPGYQPPAVVGQFNGGGVPGAGLTNVANSSFVAHSGPSGQAGSGVMW